MSLLSCSWNSPWLCPVVLVDVGHFVLSSQRRFVVPEADNERADDRNIWVTSPKNVGSFHHGQVHRPIAIQEAMRIPDFKVGVTKNGPCSAHDAASYRLLILLHDRKDRSEDPF